MNFSTFLMWQLARVDGLPENGHTEWNMDSDRGYAFKSWDWARNPHDLKRDIDDHQYAGPISVLPQLAGDDAGSPNPEYFANRDPLKLVYLDKTMHNELGKYIEEDCYNRRKNQYYSTGDVKIISSKKTSRTNNNNNNNNRDQIN